MMIGMSVLQFFAWLDSVLGPGSVDRFADCDHCQLPCLKSRCWTPGSEAVGTFTTNWSDGNNWFCPPVSLTL